MAMGRKVLALNVLEPDDILGVNTRQHLAQATAIMQDRIQDHWMTEGVTIVDPRNTYIDGRCTIGRDTVIYPFTAITGRVRIGVGCRIGPFAHLRDGTVLDDGVEVGAFVEVNRSHLGSGTIVRHLAYLGDADVGERVNVGATAVTANFDGVRKNTDPDRRRQPDRRRRDPGRPGHRRPTTRSSAPTPSSPRATTSPTARPSSASRPGRSRKRARRRPCRDESCHRMAHAAGVEAGIRRRREHWHGNCGGSLRHSQRISPPTYSIPTRSGREGRASRSRNRPDTKGEGTLGPYYSDSGPEDGIMKYCDVAGSIEVFEDSACPTPIGTAQLRRLGCRRLGGLAAGSPGRGR